jgi:hypothetical protein
MRASFFCQAGMIAAIAPLVPFASGEKPVTQFIVRVIFAALFSLTLTLFVGMVMFSVGLGLHRVLTR